MLAIVTSQILSRYWKTAKKKIAKLPAVKWNAVTIYGQIYVMFLPAIKGNHSALFLQTSLSTNPDRVTYWYKEFSQVKLQ